MRVLMSDILFKITQTCHLNDRDVGFIMIEKRRVTGGSGYWWVGYRKALIEESAVIILGENNNDWREEGVMICVVW